MPAGTALDVSGVRAGYGRIEVLHGVSLEIATGEVVGIFGPNGAGKTTLLGAMSGLIRAREGRVKLNGVDITHDSARKRVRRGLVHVLEGHRVFPDFTVQENLTLACHETNADKASAWEKCVTAFPELGRYRNSRAGQLSGGQQQMLAVAAGIATEPQVLLVDEMSVGLAPVVVQRVLEVVVGMRTPDRSIVLVEQLVERALEVVDRSYVVSGGEVVAEYKRGEVTGKALEEAYLGGAPG